LVCVFAFSAAWPQATTIPEGRAGEVLQAWLEAFNSGDRTKMEAYSKRYDPGQTADGMMSFHSVTGGFELLQIIKSDRLHIRFLVKEKNSDTKAMGTLDVRDADPPGVLNFNLHALPPGTSLSDMSFSIDGATRARVIDGAIAQLNEFYVFPDVAKQMDPPILDFALRTRKTSRRYARLCTHLEAGVLRGRRVQLQPQEFEARCSRRRNYRWRCSPRFCSSY
jgi:hypothetical protein